MAYEEKEELESVQLDPEEEEEDDVIPVILIHIKHEPCYRWRCSSGDRRW